MQRPIKKNIKSKLTINSIKQKRINPIKLEKETKKRLKILKKIKEFKRFKKGIRIGRKFYKRKKLKQRFFKRPYKNYKFFLLNNYVNLNIVVQPNNIFFGSKSSAYPQFTKILSSSFFKTKITKKRIKKNVLPLMSKFFFFLNKKKSIKPYKFVILNLTIPIKLRKKLIKLFKKGFFKKMFAKKRLIVNFKANKVFNGCTVRKQKKKKRKGFRILK
jgi:hypothetical protein